METTTVTAPPETPATTSLSSATPPEIRRKPAKMRPPTSNGHQPESVAPEKRSHHKKVEKPAAPAAEPTPPAKPAAKAETKPAAKPAAKAKEKADKKPEPVRVTYVGEGGDARRPFLKKGREFLLLGDLKSHGRPYVRLSTLDEKTVFYLKPDKVKR